MVRILHKKYEPFLSPATFYNAIDASENGQKVRVNWAKTIKNLEQQLIVKIRRIVHYIKTFGKEWVNSEFVIKKLNVVFLKLENDLKNEKTLKISKNLSEISRLIDSLAMSCDPFGSQKNEIDQLAKRYESIKKNVDHIQFIKKSLTEIVPSLPLTNLEDNPETTSGLNKEKEHDPSPTEELQREDHVEATPSPSKEGEHDPSAAEEFRREDHVAATPSPSKEEEHDPSAAEELQREDYVAATPSLSKEEEHDLSPAQELQREDHVAATLSPSEEEEHDPSPAEGLQCEDHVAATLSPSEEEEHDPSPAQELQREDHVAATLSPSEEEEHDPSPVEELRPEDHVAATPSLSKEEEHDPSAAEGLDVKTSPQQLDAGISEITSEDDLPELEEIPVRKNITAVSTLVVIEKDFVSGLEEMPAKPAVPESVLPKEEGLIVALSKPSSWQPEIEVLVQQSEEEAVKSAAYDSYQKHLRNLIGDVIESGFIQRISLLEPKANKHDTVAKLLKLYERFHDNLSVNDLIKMTRQALILIESSVGKILEKKKDGFLKRAAKRISAVIGNKQLLAEQAAFMKRFEERMGVAHLFAMAFDDKPEETYTLAIMYLHGIGVEKNASIALRWFLKSANEGYVDAMYQLARCYDKGINGKKEGEKALYWFKRAAEQGNPMALFTLGEYYERGVGVETDLNAAFDYYLQAAQKGIPDAMYMLACYLRGGFVGKKDFKQAAHWFKKAADRGHIESAYCLAKCLMYGRGIKKNVDSAAKYFRKAAKARHTDAMYFLALYYLRQGATEKDFNKALSWLNKAASAGSIDAINWLGVHYLHKGKNKEERLKGLALLEKAAAEGSTRAIEVLNALDLEIESM